MCVRVYVSDHAHSVCCCYTWDEHGGDIVPVVVCVGVSKGSAGHCHHGLVSGGTVSGHRHYVLIYLVYVDLHTNHTHKSTQISLSQSHNAYKQVL